MRITGIEVLRQAEVPAGALPGEQLDLELGDTLRVSTSLEYQGKAKSATLYAALGKRQPVIGFDEHLHGQTSLNLPNSPAEYALVKKDVDIKIKDISTGTYDLYCKLKEYPGAGMPELADMVNVFSYQLLQETVYPFGYIYDGDSEVAEFYCKTDPLSPASWSAKKIADAVKSKVEETGGQVLRLTVWADTTPVLWTNFKIEVESTPLPKQAATMFTGALPLWAGILIAAFALAFLVAVITWSIKTIAGVFKHEAISEEVKLTWSRETLIGAIQDFEGYLNRSVTPVAELNGMSDQQLRDYCDELAAVIVPPGGVSWLPWAAIGAVAVIGIGAVALSQRKR